MSLARRDRDGRGTASTPSSPPSCDGERRGAVDWAGGPAECRGDSANSGSAGVGPLRVGDKERGGLADGWRGRAACTKTGVCCVAQQVGSSVSGRTPACACLACRLMPTTRSALLTPSVSPAQKQAVGLIVRDNLLRAEALNITFRLHLRKVVHGEAGRVEDAALYHINISTAETGTHLLEIFLDGAQVARLLDAPSRFVFEAGAECARQIARSPLFVRIVPIECPEGEAPLEMDSAHFFTSSFSNSAAQMQPARQKRIRCFSVIKYYECHSVALSNLKTCAPAF